MLLLYELCAMSKPGIYSTDILDSTTGKWLKSYNPTKVYYFLMGSGDPNLDPNTELISCASQQLPSGWKCWDYLTKETNDLKQKSPTLFQWNGYDLTIPIIKSLFHVYQGSIATQMAAMAEGDTTVKFVSSYIPKGLGIKELAKLLIKFRSINLPQPQPKKYAFCISSLYTYYFYESIIYKLGVENCVAYSNRGVSDETRQFLQAKGMAVYEPSMPKELKLSPVELGRLAYRKPSFVHAVLRARAEAIGAIHYFETLVKSGVKMIMNNVAESNVMGPAVYELSKRYPLVSCNSQNGTKQVEAINQASYFDAWFVHDEKMSEILVESNVEKNQIKVVGHFFEDAISKHQYHGSLDEILKLFNSPKVISFFSSPAYKNEQDEVLRVLQKIDDPDLVVIIRSHPRDSTYLIDKYVDQKRFFLQPTREIDPKSPNQDFFDLFYVSHVSVSFASMISFQSKWFRVPAISYEPVETPSLYFVDNVTIHHVKNGEEFTSKMNRLLDTADAKDADPSLNEALVAEKVCSIIHDCMETKNLI